MLRDTLAFDTPPTGSPASGPWVGLRPYGPSESDRFFGRDPDALFLCDKILSTRLTVLYSQSGLGKSSLLRTLVVPRLEKDGPVFYFDAWSQEAPVAALRGELAKHAAKLGVPSPDAGAPTLTQLVRLIRTEDPRPLTLILDQFEEFLIAHGHQLEPLRNELATLIRTTQVDVQVVLSLREEFLAALEPFRQQIVTLFESTYRLEALDEASLWDAIRLPPRVFNATCDDELVERLIRDLAARSQGQPDAPGVGVELPMLQLVCSELWNEAQRANQSRLTVQLYDRAGGVRKILDRYIDVSMPYRWRERVLAARLMRLLAPPSGVKMAYSASDLAENVGDDSSHVASLLERLADARILQKQHSRRGLRYALQHDAFISVITPWREKVLARRDRIRQTVVTLSVLAVLIAIVLVGNVVDRSYRASADRQGKLRDLVNFVNNDPASRPTFNLLLATAAYAVGQSEPADVQRATESALRGLLASIGGLPLPAAGEPTERVLLSHNGSTLVTSGAGGVLVWDAAGLTANPPGKALAVEPRRLTNDRASRSATSPAGTWLAATRPGGGVRIWNLREPTAPLIDVPVRDEVDALTFSDDEEWLAVGLHTGDVDLWNVRTRSHETLSPPPDLERESLHAMRFGSSATGPSIFVAYEGLLGGARHGVVLRWAVDRPLSAQVWWNEPVDGYIAVAFGENVRWLGALTVRDEIRITDLEPMSPDRDRRRPSERLDLTGIVGRGLQFVALTFGTADNVAVADRSGAIGLWNATTKQRTRVLLGHDSQVNDMSFSGDGWRLASASSDGTARLWDLRQAGTHPWVFGEDSGVVRDLALGGQRPWLLTAGSNGVRRFDLESRQGPGLLLPAAQSVFGALDLSADGQWLAAGRDDGVVLLWRDPLTDRPPQPLELGTFAERVTKISFSLDGRWLVAGSEDRRIRVWQLGSDEPPQLKLDHRHDAEVASISFSPDSRWLASGSAMGDVGLWRLGPRIEQQSAGELSQRGRVEALAFDPLGHLAIALDDGIVRLWDTSRKQWSMEWPVRPMDSVEYVSRLAFGPGGRWLIAGTTRRLIRRQMTEASVWREVLGRMTTKPEPATSRPAAGVVDALVFANDGRFAAHATNGPLTLERIDSPTSSTELWKQNVQIWKLTFSGSLSSDRFLAAIADERAWVWRVGTGHQSNDEDDLEQLACRAAGGARAPLVCDDLRARLNALPGWDVCSVCQEPGI